MPDARVLRFRVQVIRVSRSGYAVHHLRSQVMFKVQGNKICSGFLQGLQHRRLREGCSGHHLQSQVMFKVITSRKSGFMTLYNLNYFQINLGYANKEFTKLVINITKQKSLPSTQHYMLITNNTNCPASPLPTLPLPAPCPPQCYPTNSHLYHRAAHFHSPTSTFFHYTHPQYPALG